jgi:protein SCO1/2
MSRLQKLLVIGLVVTAFAGGTFFMTLAFQGPRGVPQYATVLPQPAPLPQFSLVDHSGAPFGMESFRGQWSLIFFGFTHCPDICPATLQQLAIARSRVLAEGETEFPNILLISVDPERDTPEIMAEYVGHFGPGVTGVTGSLDELRNLTSALGIYFEKTGEENGSYTVDHAAVVLVINRSAEFHALFGAPHDVEHFVSDIPLIMDST